MRSQSRFDLSDFAGEDILATSHSLEMVESKSVKAEAENALVALGYKPQDATKIVKSGTGKTDCRDRCGTR